MYSTSKYTEINKVFSACVALKGELEFSAFHLVFAVFPIPPKQPEQQPVEMFPYGARRRLLYFQEYSLNESVIYEYKCANSSQFFSFYMELLHKYYTPLIMVIGFLGNFTSCLVLISTHLKLRSSSYYLAALSFADSGYLVCAFLVYCSSKDIFNLYDKQGFCQICIYLTYVFSFLSVWLIVAFTIERFIAVQYPLRRSYICTIKRAKTIVGVLSLLAFIVYVFAFFITDVIDDECQLKPEYKDLVEVINYVDTVMTLILPVVLIVGMNTMIAISLFKFRKTMQIRLTDDGSSKDIDMYHTSTSQVCKSFILIKNHALFI